MKLPPSPQAPLWLPVLLFVMVAVTHLAPDVIGDWYPEDSQLRVARAWQYVLRGVEATLLYLLVWLLTPWRPAVVRVAAVVPCIWGAAESFMIAGCRLQFPMDRPPPKTDLQTGLCDVAIGYPIAKVCMLAVTTVLLVLFLRRRK